MTPRPSFGSNIIHTPALHSFHTTQQQDGETSCLSFTQYMELCELIRELDPQVDTILLSSEDARFVEARHNYSSPAGTPWRFVVNSKDVMQGSGVLFEDNVNGHSVDDFFISFYTTLQMQVRHEQKGGGRY